MRIRLRARRQNTNDERVVCYLTRRGIACVCRMQVDVNASAPISCNQSMARARSIDILNVIVNALAMALLAYGAYLASSSLEEYKTQNALEIRSQLKEMERSTNNMVLQYPDMDALWVDIDEKLTGKKRADAMLLASMNSINDGNKQNGQTRTDAKLKIEASKNSKDSEAKPSWKNIEDIGKNILWSDKVLHEEEYVRLRRVYTLAEHILYNIVDVMELEMKMRIDPADAVTYKAYLKNIGSHPLFLHAVWYGLSHGYIKPEVANKLRQEMANVESVHNMACAVYQELLINNDCHKFKMPE